MPSMNEASLAAMTALRASLLLLLPLAAAAPRHSWDTVPLYWWGSSPDAAYTDETAAYAAAHPIVITNGNYMSVKDGERLQGGEEERLLVAAKQLAALNGSVSQFYYMNSMMNWRQYDLHSFTAVRQHPEWRAVNKRGDVVCLDGEGLFNLSVPEMRSHWLGTIRRGLETGLFAGVFADRAGPPLPTSTRPQPGPRGQAAPNGVLNASGVCVSPPDGLPAFEYTAASYGSWAAGHAEMLLTAQQHAGAGRLIIANNNATEGVAGRHFERWARTDFDKLTIAADIAALRSAGADGKLALVHGGEPCDSAAFSLSLAAFLVGASGSGAYFACSDGWRVGQGWERSQRFREYDYRLGEPLGPAVQTELGDGTVRYARRFAAGTNVTLELPVGATAAGKGCIYWAEGSITGAGCEVQAPAQAAAQSVHETLVVDLRLLDPGPNATRCQGVQGGPFACDIALEIAVQTCAGLLNRDPSVAGAVYTLVEQLDADWLADTDMICIEGVKYSAGPCAAGAGGPRTPLTPRRVLLQKCAAAKKPDGTRLVAGYIRFNATAQQQVVPNIVTLAAVLDAIPLQDGDPLAAQLQKVFDAVEDFRGFSAMRATEYMHTRHVNQTAGMTLMNPGLDVHGPNKTDPLLDKSLDPGLIDYIVKERLFNFFMFDMCRVGTDEHRLMERIATDNPWPRPIAVMGYDDTWALAGDIYEAETNCVKEHNMGQIASDGVNNLAFYSRQPPVTKPMSQNKLGRPTFDAQKTYVSFVIGDGDSIKHMKSFTRGFFLDRVRRCKADPSYKGCFPLLWSLSPQLMHLSPDWLRWYYGLAHETTHDYIVLPPSGDLYSYPAEMQPHDQVQFVTNTERDCRLMNTSATVDWEFEGTWPQALKEFYPRYSPHGIVRSLFTVNVPYMLPVAVFKKDEFYRVVGDHAPVVVFRPREWRGSSSNTSKQNLLTPLFAKEINGCASSSSSGAICGWVH